MTRITNLGRKRTYLEAGFTSHGNVAVENQVHSIIHQADGGGEGISAQAPPDTKEKKPSKKPKRDKPEKKHDLPKDELTKKDRSEKRRVRRINERHANTICFACRQKGHGARDCPTAPQSDRLGELEVKGIHGRAVGGICYRCGSTRHRLSRCKKPPNPKDPLPFAACFVCSGTGHLASSCPQNEGKGIYPKGGSCKLCGQTTHLAKDCELRKDDPGRRDVGVLVGSADAGPDEDDFLVLKRRRQEVEKEERIEERMERLESASMAAHERLQPRATGNAQTPNVTKKAKVVKF